MGILRGSKVIEAELCQFRKMLLQGGGSFDVGAEKKSGAVGGRRGMAGNEGVLDGQMVCVTSGTSLVGSIIVRRLLSQGYHVRLTVQTQDMAEKVMETVFKETGRDVVCAVVTDVMNLDSLCRAFEGCSGVFHTSAFIDPSSVSGYTKYMAENEAKAAEVAIEACVRTESVRKCVFTSSLLACIWRPQDLEIPTNVDEICWSDESLCRDKKLWFALGKTMAERAAWKAARGRGNLKLVTLCPALITGKSDSIAYLKGAEEMLADGLLATVNVEKVAEAHLKVYEDETASGRYICFDNQLFPGTLEAYELLSQFNKITTMNVNQSVKFHLSNRKLSNLLSRSRTCSYDTYSLLF